MEIKGLIKSDLVNYAPYTVATIFVSRCNFLCPFCHNPELVLGYDQLETIPEKEIFELLEKRTKWLEGICITGGEPTVHKDLPDFISKVKKLDYLVKLDTNGTNPQMLNELINSKRLDFIAMDIKAPLDKYDKVAQVKTNKEDIQKSIVAITGSGIDYEFRITPVPGLITKEDLIEIAKWLKGSKRFVLQHYRNRLPTINKSFMKIKPHSSEELKQFKADIEPYFENVEIR